MKTVMNNVPKQEIKFPCLMRNETNSIALFNSPTSGMLLNDNNVVYDMGHYDTYWAPNRWTPLLPGESVTLVQE